MSIEQWTWIEFEDICFIHDQQISNYGGFMGIRDVGVIESAISRPKNVAIYQDNADVSDLASAYAFGIARYHGFIDGNKRTAWMVSRLFLLVNGYQISFNEYDAEETMVQLAEGELSQEYFANWIREKILKL